jgi:hypothetical protein
MRGLLVSYFSTYAKRAFSVQRDPDSALENIVMEPPRYVSRAI